MALWIRLCIHSYKRVKGRSHTGRKQISTHLHKPHVMCLLGCPYGSAWCLVYEVGVSAGPIGLIVGVFLSFVFLGDARRLELSSCNTQTPCSQPAIAQTQHRLTTLLCNHTYIHTYIQGHG